MSVQYNNIIKFVQPHGYIVLTSQEDYYSEPLEKRVIIVKCNKGHHMELCQGAYINKKSLFTRKQLSMNDFCSICVKEREKLESEQEFVKEIEEKTGHIVTFLDSTSREVVYKCCTCGETNHSFISNMLTNTGVCHLCQNDKFKLQYDDIKHRIESKGVMLLTKPEEYTNNKQKLNVICTCGKTYEAILFDITRGRLCVYCKPTRYKQTCLELYGEDNVSKVPEIFDKIQSSVFRRKHIILPETKRELVVMGYEPQAITMLLQNGIQEDDIIVGIDVPRFRYKDDEDKEHIYFPDIHIKHTQLIIEVKSTYTFHYHVRLNYHKFKSVVNAGYVLRLLMFDNHMNCTDLLCSTLDDVENILLL